MGLHPLLCKEGKIKLSPETAILVAEFIRTANKDE